MTLQSLQPQSTQAFSYANDYENMGEALSILRCKVDSLTIVLEGLAVGSNWNESAMNGIFWILRDIQKHVAMLEKPSV